MAIQLSVTARNARLDAIETVAGTTAKIRIYTGSVPANCAAAVTGTLLVDITMPTDWMTNAASGVKAKTGTWSGTAGANGTAGYFRLVDNAGTSCHMQGTITATSGGGDMELDNVSIAMGQTVTVSTFSITDANA